MILNFVVLISTLDVAVYFCLRFCFYLLEYTFGKMLFINKLFQDTMLHTDKNRICSRFEYQINQLRAQIKNGPEKKLVKIGHMFEQ